MMPTGTIAGTSAIRISRSHMDTRLPSDVNAPRYPISIKGIVEVGGRVVLLKNGRGEWELPGGKLESNESPAQCVEREVHEELGVATQVDALLDVWMYNVLGVVNVFIVTFAMRPIELEVELKVSEEHERIGLFEYDEIQSLNMPEGYKRSIALLQRSRGRARE
jgi:8-oxo-dGTP pyrophosphatase MutT (NUDIX family)